ncbi:hypothetical protein RSAG8_11683, partial [Rhizoctonia solani AG-8 WAC10335]
MDEHRSYSLRWDAVIVQPFLLHVASILPTGLRYELYNIIERKLDGQWPVWCDRTLDERSLSPSHPIDAI